MSKTTKSGAVNEATGQTVADTAAEEQAKDLDVLFGDGKEGDLDVERARTFTGSGFARMSTEWRGPNRDMMQRVKSTVDGAILRQFGDAYAVLSDLYDVVREPVIDPATGEVLRDAYGFTVWARSDTGAFIEDWSRLGLRQREDFLYRITTNIFEWSQRAADLWGEALFAKAIWTESFAKGFDNPMTGTIEDRTAFGNIASAEDRYFAIYVSLLSRKADALVRSFELIGQRLKDGLSA